MSPNVLITGGLGNLGSWITQHFIDKGYQVTVLSKNKREVLINGDFEIIYADIAQFDDLNAKLSGQQFDYIVHTASVNDGFVDRYFELAAMVNVLGTRNLLEVVKDNPPKNFIYFSTFQVYGKYSGIITEETEKLPKHDYGTSHLQAELAIKQLHVTHQIPFTIFRLTNSYGCPKDLDSSKWYLILNDLSKTAFKTEEIVLKSNGLSPRDFIWMGTVADTVEKACSTLAAAHDIYNISGQNTLTMLDVANAVQDAYKEKFNKEIPVKTNQEDTTTYPSDLYVDSSKLREKLKFDDVVRFKEEALKIFELLEREA